METEKAKGIEDKFGNRVYLEGNSLYLESLSQGKKISLGFIQNNGGTWLTRRNSKNIFFEKYYAFNATLLKNAEYIHIVKIETDLDGKPKEYIEVPLTLLLKHGIERDIYREESILVSLDFLKDYIV